ncbi:MAG TPA: LamG domain-containing protein [Polyangiaceae bacterium]|nr:LamG domain-containing protein [Polyangiaceae bacterium]
MYDTSLLGDDRNALSGRGGSASMGGASTSSGGADNTDEGGKRSSGGSDAGAGGVDESGGTSTGGTPSSKGGSATTQGGSTTEGGTDTGGSVATGGSTGGKASTTGGTTGKGGTASTGGTTGGTTGGGAGKGGATSTGGAITSGGATGKGGTTSTGGTTGGTATGTGGSTGGTDGCPSDPNKTAPGVCGCGVLEQDSGSVAGCLGLKSAIVHRYAFTGTGTTVSDSIGTAHGTAVNCTLASGSVTLANTTPDQYIELPNKILSPLTNATIEVWTTWSGGTNWQRIFDFGSSTDAEGVRDFGATYLFLTPKGASGPLRASFSVSGSGSETVVNGSAALPSGTMSHVSVVVNDSADQLSVYLNGTSVGSTTFTGHLSGLNDVNTWLGRSQFAADPGFAGVLHEVRIYNAALTAAQIQLTEQTGPDPAFF